MVAEQLENKSTHKSDIFLAFMRHELHTPINAMVGYAQLFLEELEESGLADVEEVEADLRRILSATRDLARIINDLLDTSRAIDEADNVERYLGELRHQLRTPLTTIKGFSEMLMEQGAERPELSFLHMGEVHRGAQELTALLEQIVDVYYARAANSQVVAVPSSKGDVAHRIESVLNGRQSREPGVKGRILVVDDVPANRRLLARQLERMGHEVLECHDGTSALQAMTSHKIQLVLLDLIMPGLSGVDVLEQMRARSEMREIPVLVTSALDDLQTLTRCILMGAEDHLPKPCEPAMLRARVDAALEKKRLRDRELAYLENVARLTTASHALESNSFDASILDEVASRSDDLGHLARSFQKMAHEVKQREERLTRQVQELRIEVDAARRAEQVGQITESEFFKSLKEKVKRRALRDG